jgi:hypothetical protein
MGTNQMGIDRHLLAPEIKKRMDQLGKKMPGPYQWEATFSHTSYRFTTQAVKTINPKKGKKIYFGCLLTELKQLIKVFF